MKPGYALLWGGIAPACCALLREVGGGDYGSQGERGGGHPAWEGGTIMTTVSEDVAKSPSRPLSWDSLRTGIRFHHRR